VRKQVLVDSHDQGSFQRLDREKRQVEGRCLYKMKRSTIERVTLYLGKREESRLPTLRRKHSARDYLSSASEMHALIHCVTSLSAGAGYE
jgi:hypothetical protein